MWFVLMVGLGLAGEPPDIPVSLGVGVANHDLDEVLVEVAPKVEAVTGASFVRLPTIRLASRKELETGIDQFFDKAAESKYIHLTDGSLDAYRAGMHKTARQAMAIYMSLDETIYIVRDTLAELQYGEWADLHITRPVLKCLVAHELTHTLQHQYTSTTIALESQRSSVALREGHAQVVMRQVCGDSEAMAWLDLVQRADIIASADPREEEITNYVYGERLVQAYMQAHGREAIWWALDAPPPTMDSVRSALAPSLAAGWTSPALVDGAVTALGISNPEDLQLTIGDSLRYYTRAMSPKGTRLTFLPQASAALSRSGSIGDREVIVAVFALDDQADGARWVEERRQQGQQALAAAQPVHPLLDIGSTILMGSAKTLGARSANDADLRLKLWADVEYNEYWAARGHRLALIAWTGPALSQGKVKSGLEILLAPDTGPARLPLERVDLTQLPELDEPRPVVLRMHWEYALSRMRSLSVIQGPAACQDFAPRALSVVDPGHGDEIRNVALACALLTGELDRIVKAVSLAEDPAVFHPELRLAAAASMVELGEPKRGLPLLRELPLERLRDPASGAALSIHVGIQAGDRNMVRQHVFDDVAPPDARFAGVVWLAQRKDWSGLREVLPTLCPKLTAELAVMCKEGTRHLP